MKSIRALTLVNEVLNSSNWPQVTTIEGTRQLTTQKVLQAVNHVGTRLGRFIYWRFLHTRKTLLTAAKYSTGTVTVTEGSPLVTGASTLWSPVMEGRAFKVTSYEETYRVKMVTGNTALELEGIYTGDSGGTKGYTIAQDRYLLPEDYDIELNVFQVQDPANLTFISPERFDEVRYRGLNSGLYTATAPLWATVESDGNGQSILVVDPFPESQITILYSYYRQLAEFEHDEDFWPYPIYVKPVLLDGALHILNRDAKDGQASGMQLQEFFDGRAELAGLTRMADQFSRFQPDTGLRRRSRRWTRRKIRSGVEDEWPLNAPRGI